MLRVGCRSGYLPSLVGQITSISSPRPARHEGRAHVTIRAVGCGGRELGEDERLMSRTAKACGPDLAMLGSSSRVATLAGDGGKEARLTEEITL